MKIWVLTTTMILGNFCSNAQANQKDSLALVKLFHSTGGPNWTNKNNWLSKNKLSTWHGITMIGNRVVTINLYNNNLEGTIPPEIGDLTEVVELSLGQSKLTGTIPPSIGNLKKLNVLQLRTSQLSGPIPEEIGQCTELGQIYLQENKLTGGFPASLVNCKKIFSISAYHNEFSGPFPVSVLGLDSLRALDLGYNQFTGPIPAELNKLKNLVSLGLHNNMFSGAMPKLDKLVNLESIYLKENNLSGRIDTILGIYPELKYLNCSQNQFSGKLKSNHFNKNNLFALEIHSNNITEMDSFDFLSTNPNFKNLIIFNNHLNFDDLLPSSTLAFNKFFWYPQLAITKDTTMNISKGSSITLNSPMSSQGVSYKWFFNKILIPNQTSSSLQINGFNESMVGSYSFEAKHINFGNFSLLSGVTTLSLPTSINELAEELFSIQSYDNHLYIQLDELTYPFHIKFISSNGTELRTEKNMFSNFHMDLSGYPVGYYFIQLTTPQGNKTIKWYKAF